jgi:hypothetical protein
MRGIGKNKNEMVSSNGHSMGLRKTARACCCVGVVATFVVTSGVPRWGKLNWKMAETGSLNPRKALANRGGKLPAPL